VERIEESDESVDPNYKRAYRERRLKPLNLLELYEESTIIMCIIDDREIRRCFFPTSRECEDCSVYKGYMRGDKQAYEKFSYIMRHAWD